MPTPPLLRQSSNKAAALIIVLAFVVLLTGLSLAYFSRTTSERQLAHSSYNDTSSDLLARSALDIIVRDFKQEIVNGSNVTTVGGTTIYVPTNATNMVPQQSGNVAGVTNLIRRSIRSDPLSGNPGMPSRASAVNSQDNASANGRYVTSTRWNAHYLVPKKFTNTTDSLPIDAFTSATPDWVIVTRAGPTVFGSCDATCLLVLANASPTNTNYAVGRYAYAVYDEGGLLDMNTVGYPSPPPSPIPELVQDIGRKGVPSWVDVTAIVPTPSPVGTPFMKELVQFRNYATTQQSNVSNLNFPAFTQAGIDSFINYVLGGGIGQPKVGINKDFGSVNPISAPDSRTDQSFTTRAELINFLNSVGNASVGVGINVNALQYMGTFSREKNQPSLPLTPAWPFTRVVLPQRFYLANLNLAVYPSPTPTPIVTPTPTATPTLTPTIRTSLGLQFANAVTPPPATPTPTPTPGPCDLQVRWKYVGNQDPLNTTPLSAIPPFPSDFTTLDFFQYINYALFGVTTGDSTHIPFTLGIGAALIDASDADTNQLNNVNALITGIYYGSSAATCDPAIAACLVYGAEQQTNSPFNVWWVPPTQGGGCMSQVPVAPQAFGPGTGGFVPPINSPTRSVGEFGWAYSILNAANNRNVGNAPKYMIDFKDPYDSNSNPDPALLDFFTYNSAPVRSGIVSLNTRQAPVIAAVLRNALFGQGLQPFQNSTQLAQAATGIVNATTATPAMSRADIARIASVVTSAPFVGTASQDIKDTFARALSEVTQTRTWGLLIDLVAQTGHYKPNATGLADFVVEGEKRYWLHVAIDRFDGTIVGQQLEEVTE